MFLVINTSRLLHNATTCKAIFNGVFGYFIPSSFIQSITRMTLIPFAMSLAFQSLTILAVFPSRKHRRFFACPNDICFSNLPTYPSAATKKVTVTLCFDFLPTLVFFPFLAIPLLGSALNKQPLLSIF